MKLPLLLIFACVAIAVSACVVEPYGEVRGYHNGNGYNWPGQEPRDGERGGRPVWHP